MHYENMTTDVGHPPELKIRICNDVVDSRLGRGRGEGQPKYGVRHR